MAEAQKISKQRQISRSILFLLHENNKPLFGFMALCYIVLYHVIMCELCNYYGPWWSSDSSYLVEMHSAHSAENTDGDTNTAIYTVRRHTVGPSMLIIVRLPTDLVYG